MRRKLGLCDGSTALEDITRSASLGSICAILESLSFSPFITFYDMSYGSSPSYGTSLFIISHNKLPKANTSTD
tara:strand:+ start:137 stop:355 length:219 start_codon:yes stop_codon:yes gene_type:complete